MMVYHDKYINFDRKQKVLWSLLSENQNSEQIFIRGKKPEARSVLFHNQENTLKLFAERFIAGDHRKPDGCKFLLSVL